MALGGGNEPESGLKRAKIKDKVIYVCDIKQSYTNPNNNAVVYGYAYREDIIRDLMAKYGYERKRELKNMTPMQIGGITD